MVIFIMAIVNIKTMKKKRLIAVAIIVLVKGVS